MGQGASNIKFSQLILRTSSDTEYSLNSMGVKNCFGCIGLKSKQYCILNKEYSKEAYEALLPKIKEHMMTMPYRDAKGREYRYGEFFPVEISPFAYNETNAQEYFPLTKEQAIEAGYRWKDLEEKAYQPTKKWNEAYGLNDVVLCQAWEEDAQKAQEHKCTKAFKITQQELDFYQRFNIPLPQKCPNSRYFDRAKFRNPFKLWKRSCMCAQTHPHHEGQCPNEFETSFAPERKEIVYCESCYHAEVM